MKRPPLTHMTHPSGSPLCSTCGHTKLMHPENGTPCGAAACTCKKFAR